MTSDEGNTLQHQVALDTANLKPSHQYVPWIVINGEHNDQDEQQIEDDMIGYVCQHYAGAEKIDVCTQRHKNHHKRPITPCLKHRFFDN